MICQEENIKKLPVTIAIDKSILLLLISYNAMTCPNYWADIFIDPMRKLYFLPAKIKKLARVTLVNTLDRICEKNGLDLKAIGVRNFLLSTESTLCFKLLEQLTKHAELSLITTSNAIEFGEWLKRDEIQAITNERFWELMVRQYFAIFQLPLKSGKVITAVKKNIEGGFKEATNIIVKYHKIIIEKTHTNRISATKINDALKELEKALKSQDNPIYQYFIYLVTVIYLKYRSPNRALSSQYVINCLQHTFKYKQCFDNTFHVYLLRKMLKVKMTNKLEQEVQTTLEKLKSQKNNNTENLIQYAKEFIGAEMAKIENDYLIACGSPPQKMHAAESFSKLVHNLIFQPQLISEFIACLKQDQALQSLFIEGKMATLRYSPRIHYKSTLQFSARTFILLSKQSGLNKFIKVFLTAHINSDNVDFTPDLFTQGLRYFNQCYQKNWPQKSFGQHEHLLEIMLYTRAIKSNPALSFLAAIDSKHYQSLSLMSREEEFADFDSDRVALEPPKIFFTLNAAAKNVLDIIEKKYSKNITIADRLNACKDQQFKHLFKILLTNVDIFHAGLCSFRTIKLHPRDKNEKIFQEILKEIKIPRPFEKIDIKNLLKSSAHFFSGFPENVRKEKAAYFKEVIRKIMFCEAAPKKIIEALKQNKCSKIMNITEGDFDKNRVSYQWDPMENVKFWIEDCDSDSFRSVDVKLMKRFDQLSPVLLKQLLKIHKNVSQSDESITFGQFLELCLVYNPELKKLLGNNFFKILKHVESIGQALMLKKIIDDCVKKYGKNANKIFTSNNGCDQQFISLLLCNKIRNQIMEKLWQIVSDSDYKPSKSTKKSDAINNLYRAHKDKLMPNPDSSGSFIIPKGFRPVHHLTGNKRKRADDSLNRPNKRARVGDDVIALLQATKLRLDNSTLNPAEIQQILLLLKTMQKQLHEGTNDTEASGVNRAALFRGLQIATSHGVQSATPGTEHSGKIGGSNAMTLADIIKKKNLIVTLARKFGFSNGSVRISV